ncbi:Hypothetical predicted protein [Paramuricea clavata]|uniref:Uncharacterized protein n=1 Tax=Paramuricea clavata TaxID=317549 RepID=A0A6S7K005_PARCT|nr:Hypothetical predicted protein [Paramuricea clavata]
MNYSPSSNLILPTSTGTLATVLTNKSGSKNSDLFGGKCSSLVTSKMSDVIRENNCSALTFPKLASRPNLASDSHPVLLTKPKLLRKKDSDVKRYKELVLKKSIDCANAISGEQFALEREGELRRKLRELKTQSKAEMRVEKLRNKERFLSETEQLRWQRDEARMMVETKDILIKRLRMRVKQLEQLENQKEKEINEMKRELDMKNIASKNILRKLVLAKFAKKKS